MLKRIDLSRDYRKHQAEYMEAVRAVCEETAFSGGKFADRFDEEFAGYCGVPYAAGVNNGTSALHCAMMALGIGEGDEVIVPANTYIATAWGVTYTGAVPVFADCTADTWEIDPASVRKKITEKTKAVIGVHLYGQPFAYREIKQIADEHGLFVVEDCAQAHGALYEGEMVGGLGELGCFSFIPVRICMRSERAAALPAGKKNILTPLRRSRIRDARCVIIMTSSVIITVWKGFREPC